MAEAGRVFLKRKLETTLEKRCKAMQSIAFGFRLGKTSKLNNILTNNFKLIFQ